MKTVRMLAAVLMLLLFAGCTAREIDAPAPVQPFRFYYQAVETDYSSPEGLIAPEVRDLGAASLTDLELFRLYLMGPEREGLVSPFPKDTEMLSVRRSGSVLYLRLSQAYSAQSGVYQSISDACLAKTGLELEGIRQVRIRVVGLTGQVLREITLSEDSILLYDDGHSSESTTLTLYFSDAKGAYLISERRSLPFTEQELLPKQVLQLLMAGPQSEGLEPLIPAGSTLLDINVDEGLCSVDFNADFYNNRPPGQRAEQLTILSIVNSLCELSGVNQVQFYLEGAPMERYSHLNLSAPYRMDSSVVGPIREELNEFEGILYLPGQDDEALHRFPVRVRPKGTLSQAEAVLLTLFRWPTQNGLRNPLEDCAEPVAVSVDRDLCTVELQPFCLPADPAERELALRCITAALTSVEPISRVTVLEGGNPAGEMPMQPRPGWFLQAED